MTPRQPLHYAGNVSHSAITVADGDRRLEAAEGSRRLQRASPSEGRE